MRIRTSPILMALLLALPPALAAAAPEAKIHVVEEAELQDAIADKLAGAEADRQAIKSLLELPQVREIAGRSGIDIETAARAVGQLTATEAADLAARARTVNAQLVGGDTVVISATTLIIVLLILIVLILAVS